MDIKIEDVTEPVKIAEGPHWDAEQQCLYFVSILDNSIYKYVPATRKTTRATLSDNVGFIVPLAGTKDQFVVGVGRNVLIIKWNGEDNSDVETLSKVADVDALSGPNTTRLNDGKADPQGRLFAGTMGKRDAENKLVLNKGTLSSFDKSGAHTKLQNITVSNGLCWDVNKKVMYYIDTGDAQVKGYDYDISTGDMTNQRVVFDFKKTETKGHPDGMTIDTEGNLWVACFEGSQVVNIDPVTGTLLQQVPIPALQVTSVAFGGKDLDILYVTSAMLNDDQKPPCGAIFKVTGLNAKGFSGVACVL